MLRQLLFLVCISVVEAAKVINTMVALAPDAAASAVQAASAAQHAARDAAAAERAATVAEAAAVLAAEAPEAPAANGLMYFRTLWAGMTFAVMVKSACMAGNVLVQISPFPQVQGWACRGCTGGVDAAPYISIAYVGWQWCYYGAFAYFVTNRAGFLILVQSNCLGAALGTYYCLTFFANCRDIASREKFLGYLQVVCFLVVIQVTALTSLPMERALFFTGLVSSFCSFLGALAMLTSVPTAIETQNSRLIPGPLVTANLFASMLWCMCGVIIGDPLVTGPNIVATLASALCVGIKLKYPSFEEDVESAPEELNAKQWYADEITPLKGKVLEEKGVSVAFVKRHLPATFGMNEDPDYVTGETGGTV